MLTTAQIIEAIDQMKVTCDLKMVNYELVSARSLLNELGYEADADQILEAIAGAGFDYCLDSHIRCSSGVGNEGRREYPSQDVCYWGPDQLKSRLEFVRSFFGESVRV